MNKVKLSIILIFLSAITFLYFSVPLKLYPDSLSYYYNLEILQGIHAMSTWQTFRGPSLSLFFLPISFDWFHPNYNLLISTFLLFVALLGISYKIIDDALLELKSGKIRKAIAWFIFVILIVFSPLLFGYFHSFLTEPVAIFLGIFSAYLSWKWIEESFESNKKKYILYNCIFILLVMFSWFLKQPYLSVAISPLSIAVIISIVKQRSFTNILQRSLTLLSTIIFLLISISCWDVFLAERGVDRSASEYNQMFLSSSIISGVSNLRFQDEGLSEENLLSGFDRGNIESILNGESEKKFRVYTVLSPSGDVKDEMVLYYEGSNYSTGEVILFLLDVLRKHPTVIPDSYFSNYLGAINIYKTSDSPHMIFPIKEYNESSRENISIGLAFLHNEDNLLWMSPQEQSLLADYRLENDPNILPDRSKRIVSDIHLNFFKLVFSLLPFLLLYTIIRSVKIFKFGNEIQIRYYTLMLILFGYSFLHAVFHVVTGAIIDRYFFIVYPGIVLGIILLILAHCRGKEDGKKIAKA